LRIVGYCETRRATTDRPSSINCYALIASSCDRFTVGFSKPGAAPISSQIAQKSRTAQDQKARSIIVRPFCSNPLITAKNNAALAPKMLTALNRKAPRREIFILHAPKASHCNCIEDAQRCNAGAWP